MKQLLFIDEPSVLVGKGQKCTDVRDGLTLFGPLSNTIHGISSGVVGTKRGLEIFKNYVSSLQQPVANGNTITRPMFPGFEAVFNCKWQSDNIVFKEVTDHEIKGHLFDEDNYKRTYNLVTLFIDKIIGSIKDDQEKVDIWFVIVPDDVYKYCRPNSIVPKELAIKSQSMSRSSAKAFFKAPSLFQTDNEEAEMFKYDAQFHDQLKARLLKHTIPTQIFREGTLAWRENKNKFGGYVRDFSKIEGHLAWTVSTAIYYKAGGKPWKLSDIRKGVCYLGLVYKKIEGGKNPRNACCAAQMFLDSGDGTIFKGEVGPWYNPENHEYHLKPKAAKALLQQALKSYKDQVGQYPNEIFIHSRTAFDSAEWNAFLEVKPKETNLVGVTIKKAQQLKLYRSEGDFPIMRGNAFIINERSAFLWTIGFVPKIQTALSLEVPSPLQVEVNKGTADITQVLKDVMALTKLNFNACIYGDGIPVTLRFANKVGEILTASMEIIAPPLAFKYYI